MVLMVRARLALASGTSGMKATANGAINISILDGWWDEAYDGASYSAATGAWAVALANQQTFCYSLNGSLMTVEWVLNATTTTEPTAYLVLRLPASKVSTKQVGGTQFYYAGGAWDVGSVGISAGSASLQLYTRTRADWPAETGTLYLRGQVVLEVA